MASKRNSRIEVLRFFSWFIAILAIVAIPTLLLAPAVLAQGMTTRPASKFAYFADQYGDYWHPYDAHVSAYTIDSVTGSLTRIPGSPFPAGVQPRLLWADPQGRFLYEADWLHEVVSVYAIDANTGALAAIPGSPFPDFYWTDAMVGDPTGRFLYTASVNAIVVYTINPANGALTQVGEPYYAGAGALGLAVAPSGTFLYGAYWLSANVRAYAIDTVSGGLTEIGSAFAGARPSHIAITPSGNFAYVADQSDNAVFAYAINASNGALTPVAGSPFEAGSSPYFVAVDPLGKFVYVANSVFDNVSGGNTMTISGYAINQATGALTPIPGSPFLSGGLPHDLNGGHGLTIDLSGRFLYAANYYGFAIDPLTGALTPLPGSPFGTGNDPIAVTTTGLSGPLIPTTTRLTSSLDPSVYGESVSLTARVTGSGPVPPTGTVVFMWKYFTTTYKIGTATLNSAGVASLTKSNLNANLNGISYSMTAFYRGDTNNLSSTSPVLNQTVLQTTSKATLTSSPNPSTVGQAVTLTAKITSPTVTAMGPVTFTMGQTTLGTAQLSGGKATFTTSSLPAGSNVIKVTYNGNSNIARSSAAVTQVVQP